jgi:hypothetical protein
VRFADFTLSIGERQPNGYAVAAVAGALGRVSATLPPPPVALTSALNRVSAPKPAPPHALAQAGGLLFDWAFPSSIRAHLRVARDRAERAGEGLRLRLSIDAPELAAWPWELLRDTERDTVFATSVSTPILRFYDQTDRFGALAELGAELPIELLLVLPRTPDLDLRQERRNVEEVAAATGGALRVQTLDGAVTRADLADALLLGNYQCLHFGGHGGFMEGKGYLGLNEPDGAPDWLDGDALARLVVNYRATRLAVLNACDTGQTDDSRAFAGLAPQLVRYGVPAVVAMQFPITDKAAATFAREFYKRLCVGDEAGQVDVAAAYARNMLAVLHPNDRSWSAPVLFTHAPDGVIFTVPPRVRAGGALDPLAQRERLLALTASLEASLKSEDDWRLAGKAELLLWRGVTERARETYRGHLGHARPEVRQVAEQGVKLAEARLAAIDAALAELATSAAKAP